MNQEPGLDRNALIGLFLITLIMGVWLVMYQPPAPPPAEPVDEEQVAEAEEAERTGPEMRAERPGATAPEDEAFAASATGTERRLTVDHELYQAVFSSRGGTPVSFRLRTHNRAVPARDVAEAEREPVELISEERGALAVAFTSPQGRYVDSRSLYFTPSIDGDRLDATAGPQELAFEAPVADGVIRLVYTFAPDTYEISLRVEEVGTDVLTASGGFELLWDGAIPFAEADVTSEANTSGVYVRSGGELVDVTLNRNNQASQRLSGQIEWVAVKNKFFAALMRPEGSTEGAEIEGQRFGEPGALGFNEDYVARLLMPRPRGEATAFQLYLGPIEMQRLDGFGSGIFGIVDYGFGGSFTRPIAEFVVAPLFRLLGRFIPNTGIVIIIFALIIKGVLYPLTKAAYKNTARMRELQPKMEAIKEKYGDDPQKQQEAMLKMYRETGINPLAGCLPLLLQYPIIIALWRYFESSIAIRQESFLWAHDLSAPDPILFLPFTIPLYGDYVAGFTLIMGLSMILQMKVAMPATTNAMQAKIFMYVLPLVLFFVFNRFASGLSLYYLVFNLATIVQQRYINKSIEAQGVAEVQPKKEKIKPPARRRRGRIEPPKKKVRKAGDVRRRR